MIRAVKAPQETKVRIMVALAYQPEEERFYTVEEYLEFERNSEIKHEYINGRILPVYRDYDCRAMAGASRSHNTLTMNVSTIVNVQLRGQTCQPWAQDMRVRIGEAGQYSYPDVLVACPPFEWDEAATQDTLLNPKVIIEVLSPTTEAYDRGDKFDHYRHLASLTDYVLVSQEQRRIEHFRRQENDDWLLHIVEDEEDAVSIESIGCRLALHEVYERVEFAPARNGLPTENPQAPA
jgi:Uma2 family endonuclease